MRWFGNEEDATQEALNKAFQELWERAALVHLAKSLGSLALVELWRREAKEESIRLVAQSAPLGGAK